MDVGILLGELVLVSRSDYLDFEEAARTCRATKGGLYGTDKLRTTTTSFAAEFCAFMRCGS